MNPEQTRWDGGRVRCPACRREGYTDAYLNLCVDCSRWFVVDPEPRVSTELLTKTGVREASP